VPNPALVIVGGGGHATSVYNVALSAGYEIAHFVDPARRATRLLDVEVVGAIEDIKAREQFHFCIAVGDNHRREVIRNDLSRLAPTPAFPALIHASAVISCGTTVGEGTVVMPGAIVGPNSSVGRFCILNTRCSIDHDGRMRDYSSLAPGATTGGRVQIGARTAVCIGAVIKHGVTLGEDCVLGAMSYLDRDLADRQLAYGTPARVVRPRSRGEPYLK